MAKSKLRKEWEERIAAFKSSGKSGAAWCTENNVKKTKGTVLLDNYCNIQNMYKVYGRTANFSKFSTSIGI